METKQAIWQEWDRHLDKWGLKHFAANMLEAFKPVNILGAQLIYIGQPFLSLFAPERHTGALAEILEEPDELQAFVHFLRQEKPI